MMNPEPIMLLPDATVAEALARVRSPDVSPSLAAQVYVVRPPLDTPSGKFLGVAHFQRLLREPPSKLVSAVIDSSLEPVGPQAPLSTVTRYFATYNLVALPVVDELDRLLGAVTVDDVIDHMLPEDSARPGLRPRRRGRGGLGHGTRLLPVRADGPAPRPLAHDQAAVRPGDVRPLERKWPA